MTDASPANPVVLSDGTVLVPVTDFERAYAYVSTGTVADFTRRSLIGKDCAEPAQMIAVSRLITYACETGDQVVRVFQSADDGRSWRERWRTAMSLRAGTPAVVAVDGGIVLFWQESREMCRTLWALRLPDDESSARAPLLVGGPDCRWHTKRDYLSQRFHWGGDYIGATASHGGAAAVWPRTDEMGNRRLEVMIVRVLQ
jgi:hypothetical protein